MTITIGISIMNSKRMLIFVSSLLSALFLFSSVETFTYSGFFTKHFHPFLVIVFVLVTIFSLSLFNKIYKSSLLRQVSFGLSLFLMFIYFISDILEKVIYPNYTFSHFHFHPNALLLPVITMACIFVLNDNGKRVRTLFWITLTFVLLQYVIADFNTIKNSRPLLALNNLGLSYDEKMEVFVGEIPYSFAIFIKNNTPEDSTIAIPPQGYPWDKTSNVAYLRYFLHPRRLINGGEKDPRLDMNTIDYVLIDYGETSVSQYGFTNVWPKFDVDGEYIIYWNPLDKMTKKVVNGKYIYEEGKDVEEWGIIKVKK